MHREIIDHYSTYFFVEIHLKKENLKSDFWYTCLPNRLDTSLKRNGKNILQNIFKKTYLAESMQENLCGGVEFVIKL